MLLFVRRKGQGVSGEYVLLIALASIAIVGMTVYVRRAIQARYRDANREVYRRASAVLDAPVHVEYEPYYANTTTELDTMTFSAQTGGAGETMDRTDHMERSIRSLRGQKPF